MEVLYTAVAEVKRGRQGHCGMVDRHAAFEPGFSVEPGTNSEQLLALAYATGFGSALDLEVRQLRLEVTEISVTSYVSLGHGDDGCYALAVELQVWLPGVEALTAERVLRAAEEACPYCRIARGTVEFRIKLA